MKKPGYKVSAFGKSKYGEKAKKYTLSGAGGAVLEVTDYGGKVVKILAPDRSGRLTDVVIGFDEASGWDRTDPYWGAIIGRYSGRIRKGGFKLNGRQVELPALNNTSGGIPTTLHGGARGWNDYIWDAKPFVEGDDVGIIFTRISPDGEEGFPGNVAAMVTYTLTKDNVWRVEFEAVPDRDTPINVTQHVCFNLRGEASGSVDDHFLRVPAAKYLETDPGKIPTGKLKAVKGTPFDFTRPHTLGERINAANRDLEIGEGYDHCWVLDKGEMATGRKSARLNLAAELSCPVNGRRVAVWTSEPCVLVCTTNWARYDEKAKGGEHLSFRCAVALETQHAPDSPNRPKWPTTIVKAGETFRSTTEFRFSAK